MPHGAGGREMMKYRITASIDGTFHNSREHEMFWQDEDNSFRNLANPSQGFQVLLGGQIDLLAWIIVAEDEWNPVVIRMLGHPGGEKEVKTYLRKISSPDAASPN